MLNSASLPRALIGRVPFEDGERMVVPFALPAITRTSKPYLPWAQALATDPAGSRGNRVEIRTEALDYRRPQQAVLGQLETGISGQQGIGMQARALEQLLIVR